MKKIKYEKKEQKEKAKLKEQKEARRFSVKLAFYSFIITILLYIIMVFVEKVIINAEDTILVYVSASDIEKDVDITWDNFDMYFKQEYRAISTLPGKIVTNANALVGMITDRQIQENEVITMDSFSSVDNRVKGIVNPVEISFNVANIAQVVGGVLREGDYINIWSVKTVRENGYNDTKAEQICRLAYVTRAFTSTGAEVGRGVENSDEATVVINIIISAKDEAAFNKAIVDGTVRVSRVMYDVNSDK